MHEWQFVSRKSLLIGVCGRCGTVRTTAVGGKRDGDESTFDVAGPCRPPAEAPPDREELARIVTDAPIASGETGA
jgi:hypothetical protein